MAIIVSYTWHLFQNHADNVTATATALQFDFNGNGGCMNINGPTCSPSEWSLSAYGLEYTCNGTRRKRNDIASNDCLLRRAEHTRRKLGNATVTAAAPERAHSAIILIGIGFVWVIESDAMIGSRVWETGLRRRELCLSGQPRTGRLESIRRFRCGHDKRQGHLYGGAGTRILQFDSAAQVPHAFPHAA